MSADGRAEWKSFAPLNRTSTGVSRNGFALRTLLAALPFPALDGYAAWRERTKAALEIGHEVAGRIDWTETAETLRWLLVFDDDVQRLMEKLRRHVEEVGEPDEASLLRPDYTDLVRHAVFVESEAPAHARLPEALADLIHRYETMTGADALDLLFDEEELLAAANAEQPQSGETPAMPAADHDAAEAPSEPPAVDHSSRDDIAEGLAAAIRERRALVTEAEGRLIPSLAAYANWRKRADAAVDAWQRLDGAKGDEAVRDAARLGRAFDFDDRAVDLAVRLEAHEAHARAAARDPQAGLDAALLALECVTSTSSRIIDGEPLPRVLADFMERRAAWRAEQEKPEGATRTGDGFGEGAAGDAGASSASGNNGLPASRTQACARADADDGTTTGTGVRSKGHSANAQAGNARAAARRPTDAVSRTHHDAFAAGCASTSSGGRSCLRGTGDRPGAAGAPAPAAGIRGPAARVACAMGHMAPGGSGGDRGLEGRRGGRGGRDDMAGCGTPRGSRHLRHRGRRPRAHVAPPCR